MQKDMPEERLLNLIKKKVSPFKVAVEEPQTQTQKPKPPFFAQLKQLIAKKPTFRLPAVPSMKYMQLGLQVLGLIILLFLLDSLFFEVPRKKAALNRQVAEGNQPLRHLAGQKAGAAPDGDYAVFANKLHSRSLFSAQAAQADAGPGLTTTGSIFSKFALVGIMMGTDKQAIIKDTQSQKTYYLMEGQSIDGVFVEEIKEGKVVLSSEGEKFVLVL